MRDPFVHIPDPLSVNAVPKALSGPPPTLRSSAYTDWQFGTETIPSNVPLYMPAVRAKDFMVAVLALWSPNNSNFPDLTPSSAWTKVGSATTLFSSGTYWTNLNLQVFTAVATGSESFQPLPGAFNTAMSSWSYAGGVVAFSNVSEVVTANFLEDGGSVIHAPSVSGEGSSDIILNVFSIPDPSYAGDYQSLNDNNAFLSIPPGFDATYPSPAANYGFYYPWFAGEGRYLEQPSFNPQTIGSYAQMASSGGATIPDSYKGPQFPLSYINSQYLFVGPSAAPGSLGTMQMVGYTGPYEFNSAALILR